MTETAEPELLTCPMCEGTYTDPWEHLLDNPVAHGLKEGATIDDIHERLREEEVDMVRKVHRSFMNSIDDRMHEDMTGYREALDRHPLFMDVETAPDFVLADAVQLAGLPETDGPAPGIGHLIADHVLQAAVRESVRQIKNGQLDTARTTLANAEETANMIHQDDKR